MRGRDEHNETLFSFVQLENRVPRDHPLRTIRRITNEALASLSEQFEAMYAEPGVPRSRPNVCCVLCCCRPSSPSARNGN
jgi:hypothetical protein